MSKPQFVFYWADSPGLATAEARSDIASRFRAYRRKPGLYLLRRIGRGEYHVQIAGSPSPAATGVFRAIEPVKLVSRKELSHG